MPRIKQLHPKIRTPRHARAKALQRIKQRGPYKGVQPNQLVHHGTTRRLRTGQALRPGKRSATVTDAAGHAKTSRGLFASIDKEHAASFASPYGKGGGHVYSFKHKQGGHWLTEGNKHFVDSQYTKRSAVPTHVTQVKGRIPNAKGGWSASFGHTWEHASGSLPKHTSAEIHRPSLVRNTLANHPQAIQHFEHSVEHHHA